MLNRVVGRNADRPCLWYNSILFLVHVPYFSNRLFRLYCEELYEYSVSPTVNLYGRFRFAVQSGEAARSEGPGANAPAYFISSVQQYLKVDDYLRSFGFRVH